MNMIMDNGAHHHHHHQQQQHQQQPHAASASPPMAMSPLQRAELHIANATAALPLGSSNSNNNNNNNNDTHNSNTTTTTTTTAAALTTTVTSSGKTTLKRSFDVAFLMMPDERIKQKQQAAEKQARLASPVVGGGSIGLSNGYEQLGQYPTDLSPRSQQAQSPPQLLPHPLQLHAALHEQAELFQLHEARRAYPQITIRAPRIYDDPSVVLPPSSLDALSAEHPQLPLKSAFTKVASSARLAESPVQVPPPPPLSPDDQLSCSSLSPPIAITPPRTNSGGNGSLSNGSSNGGPPLPCPLVYQSFRPEYTFNGSNGPFQSVSHMQAIQAHRLKQQLFYRPPLSAAIATTVAGGMTVPTSSSPQLQGQSLANAAPPPPGSPDFLPAYPGFPFGPAGVPPFSPVGPPELPRIVQNPAAAAILSTLIPPTLASTFTLTAQNVCAKCNISFRMTSDLVYHMRSHHKSEVACDPNRRKREEKLKCSVCQETFRERHHLTRHMTAHLDKESDQPTSTTATTTTTTSTPSTSNSSSATNHLMSLSPNEIINVVSNNSNSNNHNMNGNHNLIGNGRQHQMSRISACGPK